MVKYVINIETEWQRQQIQMNFRRYTKTSNEQHQSEKEMNQVSEFDCY